MGNARVVVGVMLSLLAAAGAAVGWGQAPAQAAGQYQYPFQNPDKPLEERVSNAISLMTLQEKINFLTQRPGVPRLGIRVLGWLEGLHSVAAGVTGNWSRNAVPTTTFPQSIGLGETWDPAILKQVGATQGYEARYILQSAKYRRGGLVLRAPNSDLGRDPRWGRTEECYGEDPFFNGTLSVAYIKGMQGDDPKYWQAASLVKHFLANSNEQNRTGSSSDFDERLFMEYYSVPFRMGFEEGGARCFMASYNAWNKVPMTANPVMRNVAMKEWGVDGIISTDAGSLGNMVNRHRFYPDQTQAAAGAIKAGINQFLDPYAPSVTAAMGQNLLTEADINDAAKGTLRVMIRLGWLDPAARVPYAKIGTEATDPWTTQKTKDAVHLATQESIVLLKNKDNLLPLDKAAVKSVALIGPFADKVIFDWYCGDAPYTITPLAGVKAKLGAGAKVQAVTGEDAAAAVALAKASDVAILCVGNNPNLNNAWAKVNDASEGRESVDRKTITLAQEALIKEVLAANPKTVVVLLSSFPYAINWTQENVPAIVHMAHSSEEEGSALADVLFGDYNPAGRLDETWPKSVDQLPPMMDYNIRNGRTYMYFKGDPLYAFGYGLSYTSFEYSNLRTNVPALAANGKVDVTVDVRNAGKRDGEEVVQLYVKHIGSSVERAANEELKGFTRVAIKAGQTKAVTITLPAERLAYWDVKGHQWVVEADQVELRVGASSADIRAKRTVQVTK